MSGTYVCHPEVAQILRRSAGINHVCQLAFVKISTYDIPNSHMLPVICDPPGEGIVQNRFHPILECAELAFVLLLERLVVLLHDRVDAVLDVVRNAFPNIGDAREEPIFAVDVEPDAQLFELFSQLLILEDSQRATLVLDKIDQRRLLAGAAEPDVRGNVVDLRVDSNDGLCREVELEGRVSYNILM